MISGERKEMGTAASSRRDPPHVTENEEGKPVQDDRAGAKEIPTLPANASGQDKITTDEHDRGIDQTSMYDKRPEEDKNQPPSQRK